MLSMVIISSMNTVISINAFAIFVKKKKNAHTERTQRCFQSRWWEMALISHKRKLFKKGKIVVNIKTQNINYTG